MSFNGFIGVYQFVWMIRANRQQKFAWRDAAEARVARRRAETRAEAQLRAMLAANPSGSLGNAKLNDDELLRESGLL